MNACVECGDEFDYCWNVGEDEVNADCSLCVEMRDSKPGWCESCYFGECDDEGAVWIPVNRPE